MKADWNLEEYLWKKGYALVAGIDEAGRGALAGPVVAAAVILPKASYCYRDSKTLSKTQRENLAEDIKKVALAWAIAEASPVDIDNYNILQATHLAAKRALKLLKPEPLALVTDYLRLEVKQVVLAPAKADALSFQVAAASILAKTARDKLMLQCADLYPHYGFAQNKGYGSKEHLAALEAYGPCPLHRKSFKPVLQKRLF